MKCRRHKWKWFEGYAGSWFEWCEKCGALNHCFNYGRPKVERFRPSPKPNT